MTDTASVRLGRWDCDPGEFVTGSDFFGCDKKDLFRSICQRVLEWIKSIKNFCFPRRLFSFRCGSLSLSVQQQLLLDPSVSASLCRSRSPELLPPPAAWGGRVNTVAGPCVDVLAWAGAWAGGGCWSLQLPAQAALSPPPRRRLRRCRGSLQCRERAGATWTQCRQT